MIENLRMYVAGMNNDNYNRISFIDFFNITNHQYKLEWWKQLYILNILWWSAHQTNIQDIHYIPGEFSSKFDLISKLFKEHYIEFMMRKA